MVDAGGRAEAAYSWLARSADRADSRRWAGRSVADDALAPGRVAGAWANAKLVALGLTAPIGVPVVAVVAARSTAAARRATVEYPAQLDRRWLAPPRCPSAPVGSAGSPPPVGTS